MNQKGLQQATSVAGTLPRRQEGVYQRISVIFVRLIEDHLSEFVLQKERTLVRNSSDKSLLDRIIGEFSVTFHSHFLERPAPVGTDGLD